MAVAKIAVFASGQGTNLEAFLHAASEGRLPGELALVVGDRPCRALQIAESRGVPRLLADRRFTPQEERDAVILQALRERGITHLVLAGYLSRIGPELVRHYEGRALNLHPALLPSFPGLDGIGQALRHGVKVTGVTVHLVDEGLDSGPIVWQEPLAVRPDDTAESLRERLRPLEHRGLLAAARWMVEGRIERHGRVTRIKEEAPT